MTGAVCQALDCTDRARHVCALAIGEPGPVLDRVVRLCGTCSKPGGLCVVQSGAPRRCDASEGRGADAPEPPIGTRVADDIGGHWLRTESGWVNADNPDGDDPESWTKVAGNYGPVTVEARRVDPSTDSGA